MSQDSSSNDIVYRPKFHGGKCSGWFAFVKVPSFWSIKGTLVLRPVTEAQAMEWYEKAGFLQRSVLTASPYLR